jgi:hypothetical protein
MHDTIIGYAGLGLALLGWVYQLGSTSSRVTRSERDIADTNKKMSANLDKIYSKLDDVPCKGGASGCLYRMERK